jgi:hypothetical protein
MEVRADQLGLHNYQIVSELQKPMIMLSRDIPNQYLYFNSTNGSNQPSIITSPVSSQSSNMRFGDFDRTMILKDQIDNI